MYSPAGDGRLTATDLPPAGTTYSPHQLDFWSSAAQSMTTPKLFVAMQDSSLATPEHRRKCAPIFLHCGLLFAHAIPDDHRLVDRSGQSVQNKEHAYVREPTPSGKLLLGVGTRLRARRLCQNFGRPSFSGDGLKQFFQICRLVDRCLLNCPMSF